MQDDLYNQSYERLPDKSQIPVCDILGVKIAAIDMEWLLSYIAANLKELSGDYITVANVHTTVTAWEDPTYCRIQNGGIMAIPDGGPLSSVGRKRGYTEMSRTTGPSLMEEVFKISPEKGYRHYFYGSTETVLTALRHNLETKYPGIQIAGMYSPPFREMTPQEDEEVSREINSAAPDFVWIGLGAPKQECWMATHQGKIKGVMIGVGAGFDYHAGTLKRAPQWMQDHNLEWLYRLFQEPGRLFKRYLVTNTKFMWRIARDKKND